jgi:hypothetical protein
MALELLKVFQEFEGEENGWECGGSAVYGLTTTRK